MGKDEKLTNGRPAVGRLVGEGPASGSGWVVIWMFRE
jgi:hypothetical protein